MAVRGSDVEGICAGKYIVKVEQSNSGKFANLVL